MDRRVAERARQQIIRLCHAGLDSRALRVETLRALRQVVPLDVAFFATTDPATVLFTGAVTDDVLHRATPYFLENEFLQDDVNKFADLARASRRVSGLGEATHGELERSPRYRDILAPRALGDELRAALTVGSLCWGVMCLHRERSSPNFTPAEAAFLARLTPHLAEGLRTALLLDSGVGQQAPTGPGLIVLAVDCSVAAITPAAQEWLAELATADSPPRELPQVIYSVAARLSAVEHDAPAVPDLMPRARLRTASGRWLVIHASRLIGAGTQGQIAVILEEARPVEIAPLIAQAYDLSKRESEVTQLLARGLSTAEIAAALCISLNTVQDHLKTIFDKVGVRSRRQLVAQLFAQQYRPRIAEGALPGPDGFWQSGAGSAK
jgi:DNA-binding CsgD family transcriptional regulator